MHTKINNNYYYVDNIAVVMLLKFVVGAFGKEIA